MKVGQRIRELRQQRGLSQRELAKAVNLPNSTLSMIERDTVSPSIGNLHKILSGLDTSLSQFFTEELDERPKVVYYRDELPDIGADGVSYLLVGANETNRKLTFLIETYPPGHGTGIEPIKHEGHEAGTVLEGQITITQGKHTYVVEAGECYYLNAELPHRFENNSDTTCKLVSAMTPASF